MQRLACPVLKPSQLDGGIGCLKLLACRGHTRNHTLTLRSSLYIKKLEIYPHAHPFEKVPGNEVFLMKHCLSLSKRIAPGNIKRSDQSLQKPPLKCSVILKFKFLNLWEKAQCVHILISLEIGCFTLSSIFNVLCGIYNLVWKGFFFLYFFFKKSNGLWLVVWTKMLSPWQSLVCLPPLPLRRVDNQ